MVRHRAPRPLPDPDVPEDPPGQQGIGGSAAATTQPTGSPHHRPPPPDQQRPPRLLPGPRSVLRTAHAAPPRGPFLRGGVHRCRCPGDLQDPGAQLLIPPGVRVL